MSSTNGEPRQTAALASLRELIETIPTEALSEVERVLRRNLHLQPTAVERRRVHLGPLALLLESTPSPYTFPYIARDFYDRQVPPTATSSERLVHAYSSWVRVCLAAASIHPDGSYRDRHPRCPSVLRGRPATSVYTRDELISAIRRCAHALGHQPSSEEYARWSAEQRARDHKAGKTVRVPKYQTILRHFHGTAGQRWQHALGAAAISDSPGDLPQTI